MSDVNMEMSPRSDTVSEHSELENPPTPGSINSEHGDEDSDEESNSKVTASDKVVPQENDSSDEEDNQTEEKHSVVSPISPITPNNEASDDDMEIDEDVENTEHVDDEIQQENDKNVLEEKDSSETSAISPKDDSDEENSNEKEKVAEATAPGDKVDSPDKDETNNDAEESPSLKEESKTSSPEVPADNEASVEPQDKETKEGLASSKNDSGNLDDNDLLNITEISDLSVDLTGDEAAIVEDILQNVGDGELLPTGEASVGEEKPAADEQGESSDVHEKRPHNDDDNEEQPGGTGELINDIFGSSDEDDEEFEGFEDDELHGRTKIKKKSKVKHEKRGAIISDDEEEEEAAKPEAETKPDQKESMTVPPPDDSDSEDEERSEVFISDFDRMMAQKKEENRKNNRRRKNFDIINDNDDLVAGIIKKMKEAAQEDKLANEARQAATKKLKLLPSVLKHMLKIDLMLIFVDSNVLPVLKEWISPLPDGSLPHIQIREGVLKILEQLPSMDSGALKVSGIGKAVMYLFRHPKETRKNKERAGKIISEWSRPIFGVTANFKSMSREEREDRDYANMSKRRRLSSDGVDGGRTPKRIENAIKSDSKALRPGEKGWCMRARVPAPSNKDYVVRPKSNIEFVDFTKASKKTLNRFEKQKRKLNEKKGGSKQRAVEISLEGRKMAL